MRCAHHEDAECRSCTLLDLPEADQLDLKQRRAAELLAPWPQLRWLDPVASPPAPLRNKAKMVVAGTSAEPVLTFSDGHGAPGADLRDCPLYPPQLVAVLEQVAWLITRAAIPPYQVRRRRGELKHVIATLAPSGKSMVRLVLRSEAPLPRIREHLPALLERTPGLQVVSVNLQPVHTARIEGEQEIVLTEAQTLGMEVGGLRLQLRPRSFFQTNTAVAAALYRQAVAWAEQSAPRRVWDLYCGAGGFALHVARAAAPSGPPDVLGVEVSQEAISSARATAAGLGLENARFVAGDATAYALAAEPAEHPDLVILNPPRRGIGADLAGWLEHSGPREVIYSSCNPVTLAADLRRMPSLVPARARLMDMFPHTRHGEVITLLRRRAGPRS